MPVNIIRKIKISNWMFIIWMNNTGIITINTIKTITVPIISFYLSIYFVAHVFFLCCTTRNRPILPYPPPHTISINFEKVETPSPSLWMGEGVWTMYKLLNNYLLLKERIIRFIHRFAPKNVTLMEIGPELQKMSKFFDFPLIF